MSSPVLNMHLILASAALLALSRPHPAAGLAIQSRDVKEVTLNVANAPLSPDGYLRSENLLVAQIWR